MLMIKKLFSLFFCINGDFMRKNTIFVVVKIQKFLTYLEQRRNYSPHTITSYQTDLKQFDEFLYHDDKQNIDRNDDTKITPIAVRSWIMTLSESGVSSRSINRKISSLKAYFKWKEINDTGFKNPMLKIIPPKTSKRKLSAISLDDMTILVEKRPSEGDFDAFRNYIIMEILYATGIRRAEILSIKHSDISFNHKQIRIIGKGSKERFVPIGDKLIDDLIKYIALKQRYNIKESSLIVTKQGKPLTANQLYYIIHTMLKTYNVGERSPHVFRHTCATHLISNGADIINVKNLLGHTSLKATEVYTHTTIEELKKEYKRSFEQKFNK